MESVNGYADDVIDGADLTATERRRPPYMYNMSRNQDSPRSTSYAKQDSGFITNSSLSRDASPTRDSLMRKTLSSSTSAIAMGKYVLDRYKSPAIESMRNHALISTFEDLELEKLLLKDENSDMKDKIYQFQNLMRQLETSRARDAERFELQEREVSALRLQLKAEKDGKQAVVSLAEELQSDLARKSDLLAIANEELIETRDRLRNNDKQLHDEGNARSLIERTAREFRERLDDVSTELETEKKLRKGALENLRESKEQIVRLEGEVALFTEAIKDIDRTFDPANKGTGKPVLRLPNPESEEKLYRMLKIRDDINVKVNSLQKDVSTKTTQFASLTDEILNFARILRSEVKDEVTANTVLGEVIFRENRLAIGSARVSTAMEPLQNSLTAFLDYEMKKRKILKESVEECLRKFSWSGQTLNETQLIQLLSAILLSWNNFREQNSQIYSRLVNIRKKAAKMSKTAADSAGSVRTALANYKNTVLAPSRHRLDEELYRFADKTKTKHETARRSLEANHQTRMANETKKVRTEQEAKLTDAVNKERQRIQQLEAELASLTISLKAKDEYAIKLTSDVRDAESKLFRMLEGAKQTQKEHALTLAAAEHQQATISNKMQTRMKEIQADLEQEIAKLKRDLENRAKTIAVLDGTIVAKDQRVAGLQAVLKERTKKQETLERELAAEKDPSRNNKLAAAIKTYEREVVDLKAKVAERDTLVSHLKKRVDEALNRGQKKVNEATERSRAELMAKEAKYTEKEKEVEKLQDQLTRLSRVVSKSTVPAKMIQAGDTARSTTLSVAPSVRALTRSVSGSDTTRLPPIVAAGTVGGDPSSNDDPSNNVPSRSSRRKPNQEQSSYRIFRSLERLTYQPAGPLMAAQEEKRLQHQDPVLPPWRPPSRLS